jgi:hypothetical protein
MFPRSYLPRFSIRQLLLWTAFIGFACVSLRNASETWVAIAFAVVLMIIGVMPMLVILHSGADRAYWMGFMMIGGRRAPLGKWRKSFGTSQETQKRRERETSVLGVNWRGGQFRGAKRNSAGWTRAYDLAANRQLSGRWD